MQLKNYNVYFFLIILLGGTALAYFILKPFLIPVIIAVILAHLFSPVYNFFLKIIGGRKGIASFITCLVVMAIIIVPLFFVISLLVNEVQDSVHAFSQNPEVIQKMVDNFSAKLSSAPLFDFVDSEKLVNEKTIVALATDLSQNALVIIGNTYASVADFIFSIVMMFFSLFYFFIDGKKLIKKIMQLSPLQDKYENILIEKFNSMTRATIKGTILIAILQGFLSGLLFLATGVFSPVLLGVATSIASVIPSIGSGLIWFPVGVIMIILGHFSQGITILLVGALVISTIDNVIRPKLVGDDTQMHPLLILFSTLGGIALFGITGFIVGPVVMSIFVALWDIYAMEFKNQLEKYNT